MPSTRLSRIARLALALQRCATGSPARCTTASRPASACGRRRLAERVPGDRLQRRTRARASVPRAVGVAREHRHLGAARPQGGRPAAVPIRPVAPVTVTRSALTPLGALTRARRIGAPRAEARTVIVSPWREADLLAGQRGARRARLLGDRGGDRGSDVAVEHRRDDVVLAQLASRRRSPRSRARRPSSSPR